MTALEMSRSQLLIRQFRSTAAEEEPAETGEPEQNKSGWWRR